ncbi:MAG: c-type cytochrome, partial [Blastopirellula sp. JB062]
SLLIRISEMVGARPEAEMAQALLKTLASQLSPSELDLQLLDALGDGLARRGSSLHAVIERLPTGSPVRNWLDAIWQEAAAIATASDDSSAIRQRAVRRLAYAPWTISATAFDTILSPQTPEAVQAAALETLAKTQNLEAAAILVDAWSSLTPKLRTQATETFLSRQEYTESFLDALESGAIKRSEINRASYPQLLKHPKTQIRLRAEKLLAEGKNERRKIVDMYQPALKLTGSAKRGRALYEQKCATCHKLGDVGHEVGPDLASVQNKTPSDLLVAILDPNREAQLRYTTYAISTLSGQIYTGMIAAESSGSLTLRRGEGKEDVVLRDQIDEMISSGQSLMPEGLEKEIDQQQLADLIAFIKSLKGAAP